MAASAASALSTTSVALSHLKMKLDMATNVYVFQISVTTNEQVQLLEKGINRVSTNGILTGRSGVSNLSNCIWQKYLERSRCAVHPAKF